MNFFSFSPMGKPPFRAGGVAAWLPKCQHLALIAMDISISPDVSAEFKAAVDAIRSAEVRDEIHLKQIEEPEKLATHAIAFSAHIVEELATPADAGTGRFVLLWEPEMQEAWGSRFRVVCFAKSPLETNIGADELGSDIAWAWLTDALSNRHAEYGNAAGTATRIISSGYGSLASQSDHAELEVRASWSPKSFEIGQHLEAWQDLVCIMSGFAHLPQGVSSIAPRNNR
jgi:hypothetical protein